MPLPGVEGAVGGGGEARQALYFLSVALLIAVYRTTTQQFIKHDTRVQGTLLWACLGL